MLMFLRKNLTHCKIVLILPLNNIRKDESGEKVSLNISLCLKFVSKIMSSISSL